ncbi:MAG: zinc ribbon domain-containing protein [Actinobacteria bacterium]|nr:zinc ribbon domain-containing protein [Actinomycetota bacterium]
MPIYTYKCTSCSKIFEKFKNMSSNGKEYCEDCSSEAVRVFTPAGIIFKGPGFYTTDYKSVSNKTSAAAPAKKEEKKEAKVQEKPSDSPTAKTTESKEKNTTSPKKE